MNLCDFCLFVVSLLGSFGNDFWMDFGVVLRSKLEPKSSKNLSKRVSKRRSDFERILDASWTEFGSILDAMLGLCWGYVGSWVPRKEHSKNISKNMHKKEAKEQPRAGGVP